MRVSRQRIRVAQRTSSSELERLEMAASASCAVEYSTMPHPCSRRAGREAAARVSLLSLPSPAARGPPPPAFLAAPWTARRAPA